MNESLSSREQLESTPVITVQETAAVHLDEVIQDIIGALQCSTGHSKAIIRFDALPVVYGSRAQFQEVFELLFHSIVMHGSAASKPFIYIRCEAQCSDEMDLRLPEDRRYYKISVYTNIAANHIWLEQHCHDIDTMKGILSSLQGSLTYSTLEKTGCLYLITLPGKI